MKGYNVRGVKFWLLMAILTGLLTTTAAWADTKKLIIKNNSGYPDNQIYLVVWGYPFPHNKLDPPHYLKLDTGDYPTCKTGDNTYSIPPYPEKYCEYWYTLAQIKQPDGTYAFMFPQLDSGRLYISLGKPVYLHINDGDLIGMREPSTNDWNDPNYKTIFDKFEWTYDDKGLHANTTCVDFFGLPLQFEMKDASQNSLGKRGFSCSRGAVYRALGANPLLQGLKTDYRFYSPNNLNSQVSFPPDYFKDYIDFCWNYYRTRTITINGTVKDEGAFTATGQVNGSNVLVFTVTGTNEPHTIGYPSSYNVFNCGTEGIFKPVTTGTQGNQDRDGYIKDEVASALNRTVMHLAFSEWGNKNNYYKQSPDLPADKFRTNIYSQILHQISIANLMYGYPWDDKYNQESYLSSLVGAELTVTINNCKSNGSSGSGMLLFLGDKQ
jgi:hypothetical protein